MLNSNEYSIKQLDLANQKIRYILEIKKKDGKNFNKNLKNISEDFTHNISHEIAIVSIFIIVKIKHEYIHLNFD